MPKGTRSVAAVAIALLLPLIAMWTVLPAPDLLTLTLAVAVPELALPLAGIVAVLGVGLVFLAHGRARYIVAALVIAALALLTPPIMEAPGAQARADAALRAHGIAPLRAHPPAGVDVTRDIPVPLRDGARLALDLYRPRGTVLPPLVVTIYGGAWRFGSRAAETRLAGWLAANGYAVAVIDYRHAPAYRYPVELEDVDDAFKTIALLADEWHVDRARVAIFGRSAGAQLALLAAERDQPVPIRAAVAYYAPSDLIGGYATPPQPDPAHARDILEAYLGGPPDAAHIAAYRGASPIDRAHAGMPPVLAIIGDRDELVLPKFQRAFAARLNALHVPNVAIELPWSNHAFDAVNGLGAGIANDATLRFFATTLRSGLR
jgi:acetyl esterase/lipase